MMCPHLLYKHETFLWAAGTQGKAYSYPVFQRPRRVGAKFTGVNIAPDEHMQPQLTFDYDGKRDRWNGYNPEEHMKIVEEYAKVDLVSRIPAFLVFLTNVQFALSLI